MCLFSLQTPLSWTKTTWWGLLQLQEVKSLCFFSLCFVNLWVCEKICENKKVFDISPLWASVKSMLIWKSKISSSWSFSTSSSSMLHSSSVSSSVMELWAPFRLKAWKSMRDEEEEKGNEMNKNSLWYLLFRWCGKAGAWAAKVNVWYEVESV